MKVNYNRTKVYNLSESSKNRYYYKYLFEIQKLQAKGVDIKPMSRNQFLANVDFYRVQAMSRGKYLSDVVKTVVDEQKWAGKLRRNEAIEFRKAAGLKETYSLKQLMKFDREELVRNMSKEALSNFWNMIKNNQTEIDKWNERLGTNFTTDNASELISYYFFGSK